MLRTAGFFVKRFSYEEILSSWFISKNIKSLSLPYLLRHINSLFYDKSLLIKVINAFPADPSGRAVWGRSSDEIVDSNPTGGMDVCCECCVLSDRGFCDEPITRPEESYRLWCVAVCDLETSRMRRPWPALCRSGTKKKSCDFHASLDKIYCPRWK